MKKYQTLCQKSLLDSVIGFDILVDVGKAHEGTGPEVDEASSHSLLDRILAHVMVDVHKLVTLIGELWPGHRNFRIAFVGVTGRNDKKSLTL